MTDRYSFNRVFSAACIGMLLFGIVIITLGSILPTLITNFQLDGIKAGYLTSLLPLGILVGSLVFGPIVDRYSYKYLLITCTVLVMVGIEALAFTNDLYLLQLSVLVIGLGGGAINGGTNALVADISESNARGRGSNLSFLGVFFGIGALGMPFILGLFSQFHYRSTLSSVGLMLIIPIVYFFITRFPTPKHLQTLPINNILGLVKDPSLLLLGLILFFQSGIEGIINNWTTLYLQTESNFIQGNALYALSLFVLSLTLTRVVLIFLLKHIRSYLVLVVSILLVNVGILCFMYPILPEQEILALILLGIGPCSWISDSSWLCWRIVSKIVRYSLQCSIGNCLIWQYFPEFHNGRCNPESRSQYIFSATLLVQYFTDYHTDIYSKKNSTQNKNLK